MGSNQDVTPRLTEFFDDPATLRDAEAKLGQLYFTKDQKLALAKLVGTPVWDILKITYVKQRLVQIAVSGLSVAQNMETLQFAKGKAAEANQMIKDIELIVQQFNKEEEDSKKPKPKS